MTTPKSQKHHIQWISDDIHCCPKSSVIFVTKTKKRTRIIGLRFQKTRTKIIVIQ